MDYAQEMKSTNKMRIHTHKHRHRFQGKEVIFKKNVVENFRSLANLNDYAAKRNGSKIEWIRRTLLR